LSNSYGRCGANGAKSAAGYPKDLTKNDVGITLSNVKVTAVCNPGGLLESAACSSETIGDGKIGGGVDTPSELPPGGGGLPNPDGLEELDGIVYITGMARQNQNWLQCSSTGNNTVSVHYCDFTKGECDPTNLCVANSNNIRCQLSGVTWTHPTGGSCQNVDCQYKIKIKFTKGTSTTYPTNCKLGG